MLISTDGRLIYADLLGEDGAQVVLLAHSLAADSGMWAEQVPALLADGWRVLRIDMRGHGGSHAVEGPATMEDLAADFVAVLDDLGIDKVHYVGLSIGGMIGQGFALSHPERLHSLTLCDTLPASPPGAVDLWAPRISAVAEAGSTRPVAEGTISRWLGAAFKKESPRRWRQIFDTIVATQPQGFIGCAQAIANFDYEQRHREIATPTLVICGSEDPGAPPAASRRIVAGIPDSIYEEIPGAMHFPNVERPAAFNRVLLDWLDKNR